MVYQIISTTPVAAIRLRNADTGAAHLELRSIVKFGDPAVLASIKSEEVSTPIASAIAPEWQEWLSEFEAALIAERDELRTQLAAAQAVVAERDAAVAEVERLTALLNPPRVATHLDPYDFRALFTDDEIVAALRSPIATIAAAVVRLCTIKTFVDMEHADTQMLLGAMLQTNILTEERLAQVQAMQPVQ